MRHIFRSTAARTATALAFTGVLTAGAAAPAAHAAAPKRVVALTPFSANTMALLGAKPIAVGQALGGPNLFAPALRSVTKLPLSHPNGPNLEQLAKLKADYVFTGEAWSRGTAPMKRLGIRVANREPRAITDVPRQTARIGAAIGRGAAGKRLAATQTNQIHAALAGIRKHPKVLLVLGVGTTPYAFLPNSWGGNLIQRAGGTLITAGLKSSNGYARISDEYVVAQNPDIIIAIPHGNPDDLGEIATQLKSRPGWKTTRAARAGHVYISTDNTLLQPISGVASVLSSVRRTYLKN
ncbi:MAG: ABC transporter substrate-binding protein [Solirubrobacteraceae bacterium]|nr:ABC transporter substrate-binding protein [Patulibacter sp.]